MFDGSMKGLLPLLNLDPAKPEDISRLVDANTRCVYFESIGNPKNDVPDFRKESSRKAWENDDWSPFPSHAKAGQRRLPPSILGYLKPSRKGMALAKKLWAETA